MGCAIPSRTLLDPRRKFPESVLVGMILLPAIDLIADPDRLGRLDLVILEPARW